jgi:putative ABC transport system permease protein
MSKLGFNIMILPGNQNLGDWYADDYASRYMPEEVVGQLEQSKLTTIEHLIPCLRQKIKWPETKWTVIVIGKGNRILNPAHESDSIPFEAVPEGKIILGHEIHKALKFKTGDKVALMNRNFTVHKCRPEQGSKDDITIWLNLRDLQKLLDKTGLINEIRAMETDEAWSNIVKVRKEITELIPETQVIEISDIASAKTAARTKALEEGKSSINRERNHRKDLKTTWIRMAWGLIPLVLIVCTGWLGLLSFRNVQDRRPEIGILMSLGYNSNQILKLFLMRSSILAVVGGFTGVLCTIVLGTPDYRLLTLGVLVAIAITTIATYGPAVSAAGHDPADVLRCD